ncbi:hypothetical protein NQ176_g10867 [Zarea fungicola]|uniref:Uncharacterized protein n=1 Tax=Zarea fungicola TaxID=93591 RepID=A0ACC1MEL5_9HYPO|nr:hypothetical protein NQ176_g10867 [Lecanicillium fungicola]
MVGGYDEDESRPLMATTDNDTGSNHDNNADMEHGQQHRPDGNGSKSTMTATAAATSDEDISSSSLPSALHHDNAAATNERPGTVINGRTGSRFPSNAPVTPLQNGQEGPQTHSHTT